MRAGEQIVSLCIEDGAQSAILPHQFTVEHNVQIDGAGIPAYFPDVPVSVQSAQHHGISRAEAAVSRLQRR